MCPTASVELCHLAPLPPPQANPGLGGEALTAAMFGVLLDPVSGGMDATGALVDAACAAAAAAGTAAAAAAADAADAAAAAAAAMLAPLHRRNAPVCCASAMTLFCIASYASSNQSFMRAFQHPLLHCRLAGPGQRADRCSGRVPFCSHDPLLRRRLAGPRQRVDGVAPLPVG